MASLRKYFSSKEDEPEELTKEDDPEDFFTLTKEDLDEAMSDSYRMELPDHLQEKWKTRTIHALHPDYLEFLKDCEQRPPPPIDPKNLGWLPWLWYQITWFSDYIGKRLASFFGITAKPAEPAVRKLKKYEIHGLIRHQVYLWKDKRHEELMERIRERQIEVERQMDAMDYLYKNIGKLPRDLLIKAVNDAFKS